METNTPQTPRKFRLGITLLVSFAIFIILAVLVTPILRQCVCGYHGGYFSGNRRNSIRWSEGKACMGTIATGIRAYVASDPNGILPTTLDDLGFKQGDLEGTYFCDADFAFIVVNMKPLKVIILAQPSSDYKWEPKSQAFIIDGSNPSTFIDINSNEFNFVKFINNNVNTSNPQNDVNSLKK